MATMTENEKKLAVVIRKMIDKQARTENQVMQVLAKYEEFVKQCEDAPRSITAEIDAIPGRRIFYNLSDSQTFDADQAGLRGTPLSFLVSQDGAFIATHYPLLIWRPNTPSNATNFGAWSPVASWPLPTQQNTNQDCIDLSYEVVDSGSQRNFQNEASPPVFSRPDNIVPLPVPTLFSPNTTIQLYPTYERIFFDPGAAEPTTGGVLVAVWPGYKCVNM